MRKIFLLGIVLALVFVGCVEEIPDKIPEEQPVQPQEQPLLPPEEPAQPIEETPEEPPPEEVPPEEVPPEEVPLEEPEVTAVSMPESIENNCIGFLVGNEDEIENIPVIGAAWTRPHPGPFAWGFIERNSGMYDFHVTDDYVREAGNNDVAILPTVWPFADWDRASSSECMVSGQDEFYPRVYPADPGGFQGIPTYRCKPKDMQAYKRFLAALVERYDGDGINDMPDLKIPIKYWEVLNEPELDSEHLTFFLGDEEDYLEVLRESYLTIKESCPDCKVLHGGAAGTQTEFLAFWDNLFELGTAEYFDIANIHHIGGHDPTLNVAEFKSLLDEHNIKKPIWVTEAEFDSPDADAKALSQGALDAGADKIFFVSFEVGGHRPVHPGQHHPVYEEIVGLCPQ